MSVFVLIESKTPFKSLRVESFEPSPLSPSTAVFTASILNQSILVVLSPLVFAVPVIDLGVMIEVISAVLSFSKASALNPSELNYN